VAATYFVGKPRLALIVAVCWLLGLANSGAASSFTGASQAPYADRPPSALVVVGAAATELFDAARLSNWRDADVAFRSMKESALDLPTTWSKPDLASTLQSRVVEAGDALSARQPVPTMDFANGITRLVAELSAEYQTRFPYALVLLDYYGRELQLGIAAGDRARLKSTTEDLQQTWNRFETTVLQRGSIEDARRISDSVAELLSAQAPEDFVAPTQAEQAAVDHLKRLFEP
jgi:hypothetical protein